MKTYKLNNRMYYTSTQKERWEDRKEKLAIGLGLVKIPLGGNREIWRYVPLGQLEENGWDYLGTETLPFFVEK